MIYVVGMIGIIEGIVLHYILKKEWSKNDRIQDTVMDLMTVFWKIVIDYKIENPMGYLDFVRNVKIMDVSKNIGFEQEIEMIYNKRKREGKTI